MAVYPYGMMPTIVRRYAEAVKVGGQMLMKEAAAAGHKAIVEATPVDTSLAVSNWQLTLGAPAFGVVKPVVTSVKGSGEASAKSIMKAKGIQTLHGYQTGSIFITNKVPYIGYIEHGSRTIRPYGMVAKGLQAMRVRVKEMAVLDKRKV